MRILFIRGSQLRRCAKLIRSLITMTCIALLALPVSADQTVIYKSVAKDGSVEFSDQAAPSSGVTAPVPIKIANPESQDSDANPAGGGYDELIDEESVGADSDELLDDESAGADSDELLDEESAGTDSDELLDGEAESIDSVTISSPAPQETLSGLEESVLIAIETAPSPNIPKGVTAEVILDGKQVMSGSSVVLPIGEVGRGTHRVQVRIVDSKRLLLAESAVHEFYVKQSGAESSD